VSDLQTDLQNVILLIGDILARPDLTTKSPMFGRSLTDEQISELEDAKFTLESIEETL
jgi:hypothetical protein